MVSQVLVAAASVVIDVGECTPLDGPGQPSWETPIPLHYAVYRGFPKYSTASSTAVENSSSEDPPESKPEFPGGLCR